jgi:hypothetical protein
LNKQLAIKILDIFEGGIRIEDDNYFTKATVYHLTARSSAPGPVPLPDLLEAEPGQAALAREELRHKTRAG